MATNKRKKQKSLFKPRKYSRAALAKRNRTLWFLGVIAALILCTAAVLFFGIHNKKNRKNISPYVKTYMPQVEKYAAEAGISGYENYVLAIMQVESGGWGNDVMQSSESLGLPPNTLDTEESIQQGCAYLAENMARAEVLGCDIWSAVQAYNFGIDYLDFVAAKGGVQSIEISEEFARERSGGTTVEYNNKIAKEYNGGYRYRYGNMFYAELVKKLVEEEDS